MNVTVSGKGGRRGGKGGLITDGIPRLQAPPTSGSLRAVLQHEVSPALYERDVLCLQYSTILHQVGLEGIQDMLNGSEGDREGEREGVQRGWEEEREGGKE